MTKPSLKPDRPYFSCGPAAKRPGWHLGVLEGALLGRSHRAAVCKTRMKEVIDRHRMLLGIPAEYKVAIVPASDTGAVEMALWSLLGARGVDVFAWESFSKEWMNDITQQLKLDDARVFDCGYGDLPDLSQAGADRDIVFVWNGTTSGVRVPDANWIADDRTGLTICDATSAVFAYDLPWSKLDVTTWSWQKVAGGEAAHGMIVLSPRAVERLTTYIPPRAIPKVFRMTGKKGLNDGLFDAADTLNTPSMLAVEDCIDSMKWVERVGGLAGTMARCAANAAALEAWVQKTDWVDYLREDVPTRSITSVCLKIVDPTFTARPVDDQIAFVKKMTGILEKENVAYDIAHHRDAPPGLRIWCGATVEAADVAALGPWMEWAYVEAAK